MSQFARLISRRELALVQLAGDDRHSALRLEPGLVVATNGHILGALKVTSPNPDEFPMRQGLPDSMSCDSLSIPAASACAALKALPKRTTFPILEHAALWIGESKATLYVTNLDSWQEFTWQRDDVSQFPNWRKIWPNGKDARLTVIGFDATYWKLLQDVVRECVYPNNRRTDPCPVSWKFHGPKAAAIFQARTADADLRGLLMPTTVETDALNFGCP